MSDNTLQMTMTGDWRAAMSTMKQMDRGAFGEAIAAAVSSEAMLMEAYVAQGFRDQGLHRPWTKLSPVTLAIRKHHGNEGTKILQSSNDLRRSVTSRKMGKYTWFVGVHKSARTSKGKKLVNVAAVHEGPFPTLVPCDTTSEKGKKVRNFFMALFLQGIIKAPLSPKRAVLVIMPRPFLKPAFDKVRQGSRGRVMENVQKHLIDKGVIPR